MANVESVPEDGRSSDRLTLAERARIVEYRGKPGLERGTDRDEKKLHEGSLQRSLGNPDTRYVKVEV